ncbi:MAG: hypothetical protein ACRDVM_07190 [Acidimicrobiia bacterium]
MPTERELLEKSMERLHRAFDRGTGTSFEPAEVQVIGKVIHALGTAALGGPDPRRACAVCGRPEHPEQAVDDFGRHAYAPGLLVPLLGQ